ncbi:hypothetical protein OMP43_19685 [Sphingomonas sp. CBMAI 2297]|uniref:hypothetical protein n=1 Tax=Sphingomonas sp. CBMAI 2297 TaxID=2991720 RepID=UPI0024566F20|nr:hypothetical protein [Sphingomonas sp. CBMAI 2297]MDH4746253.1 hypothetical protein [Sphingomonas sp. CBMAI 2297]
MTDYPLLRASLAPQYAQLPPDRLNDLVRSIYGPNATAEDVEGLFDDIGGGLRRAAGAVGNFAQKAAPVLARALPSVASGATGGAAFGPWGALIGAGAGLASGLLSQSGSRTARDIGGAIHNVGGLVSTVRGGGANGALGSLASVASGALGRTPAGRAALSGIQGSQRAPSGGAANMLAGLLARPELAQSLMSSLMGGAGRQNVSISGQQVPVSQMLSTLSNVAGRAAHEAAEAEGSAEDTPEYASAMAEAFGIDPEDSEGRSDALLALLALTPSIWMNRPAPVNVQVNPADPYFPAGESAWAEWEGEALFDEDWSEDWGEDWGGEDYAENDESVEYVGV